MKMRHRTIVLTDLDDTLVDRGTSAWEAMKKTFAERFKVDVSIDEIANAIGHDTLTKKYNCDWLTFWSAFDTYDNREEAIASGKIKLYPDALQFMKSISEIADIVVTTDTPPPKAFPEIMNLGLARYISGTAAYTLGHKSLKFKPDISVALRAFRVACEKGYKPERTENRRSSSRTEPDKIWVVGDGINDMEFAENIKQYVAENGFDAVVRSIYIHRRGPTDIKHDYRTFGPNPLLTAAKIIRSNNPHYEPKAPIEVCWSETAIIQG